MTHDYALPLASIAVLFFPAAIPLPLSPPSSPTIPAPLPCVFVII